MRQGTATDPRSRHLPDRPLGLFFAFDAILILISALLSRSIVLLAGSGLDFLPIEWRAPIREDFLVAWAGARMVAIPMALHLLGQYNLLRDPRARWSFPRVVLANLVVSIGFIAILYALGYGRPSLARTTLDFVLAIVLLSAVRAADAGRTRALVQSGRRVRNVLLVGDDPTVEALGREFLRDPFHGRRVVGFVRDTLTASVPLDTKAWSPESQVTVEAAVLENSLRQPRHLWAAIAAKDGPARARMVDGLGVEEILISNRVAEDELVEWVKLGQERQVNVHLLPQHHEHLGLSATPWTLGNYVLLDIHKPRMNRLGSIAKRTMDITLGLVGLAIASPLLLACAIAIKLEHPRSPVFYGGKRVGLKGRHFRQWKLATMRPDADKFRDQLLAKNAREGPWFQLDEANDPRISKVGKVLRRYSLNDLPQFWNVVNGTMSIVGPRPLAADEASRFVDFDFRYFQCFDVKPGITGLWQISDRLDPSFERRFQLDVAYIQEWSFWRDVKIMLMTPWAMMKAGR